jgi:hypothetical protein
MRFEAETQSALDAMVSEVDNLLQGEEIQL